MIVFGGFTSIGERTNDIYKYTFKDFKWEKIVIRGKEYPSPRSGHSAVIFEDSMFIFGGKD